LPFSSILLKDVKEPKEAPFSSYARRHMAHPIFKRRIKNKDARKIYYKKHCDKSF